MHIGRNDPCPCGSGKKYKRCCLDKRTATPLPYKILASAGVVILIVCIFLLVGSIRGFSV